MAPILHRASPADDVEPVRQRPGRVFFDSLAGYALARLRFRGRWALFADVIAVLAVPGVVLLIPKFLVLNQFQRYFVRGGTEGAVKG